MNTDKLEEYVLGSEGLKYIKDCLQSGHSLAKYLLKNINFNDGKITTYLPPNIPHQELNKFESGKFPLPPKSEWKNIKGGVLVPIHTIKDYMVTVISDFLKANPHHVCIFENFNSESTDPWLNGAKSHVIFFKNEVLHFIQNPSNENQIKDALNEAKSLPFFTGCMAKLEKSEILNVRAKIPQEFLSLISKRAEKVIVSAYDGEGYIIWKK